jgi:uncharacterized protein (UPF0212 family)
MESDRKPAKVCTICPCCGHDVLEVGFTLHSEKTSKWMRVGRSVVEVAHAEHASKYATCNCGARLPIKPMELLRAF